MMREPHAPTIALWGGPLDGLEFQSALDTRHIEPPRVYQGYRRSETALHGDDNSVCYVVYIWREVW